tara:strand:+ start:145 stop:306 length:162 start_codon:yes stop_codon:yes gene_type:complete
MVLKERNGIGIWLILVLCFQPGASVFMGVMKLFLNNRQKNIQAISYWVYIAVY